LDVFAGRGEPVDAASRHTSHQLLSPTKLAG
jgi:hypothetical protein